MTTDQMKAWIDEASYEQLLAKWRNEPSGSAWFQGEIGTYYSEVMKRKGEDTPQKEQVAASKSIGWD